MGQRGPSAIVDERDYVPRDLEEARRLGDALVKAGTQRAHASAIVMWLANLPEIAGDDPILSPQRVRYRKELARLGAPPWGPRPSEYMGASNSSADLSPGRERGRILRFRRRPALDLTDAADLEAAA